MNTKGDYYKDVEALFTKIVLVDTPEVRKIIELIEHATYFNDVYFTDRFGVQLYVRNLSTGCKAALCVLLGEWDKPISLLEVGSNACYVIVSLCKDNHVLLRTGLVTFVPLKEDIDVICEGHRFLTHDDLSLYLLETGRS